MKHCKAEFDCVENKFLRLPNVERYDIVHKTKEGFVAQIEMEDGYEFLLNVYAYSEVFPSTAIELIEKRIGKIIVTLLFVLIYLNVRQKFVNRMESDILIMLEIVTFQRIPYL